MPFLHLLGLLTHMLLTNVHLAMGLAMVEPLSAILVLLLLHPMATTVFAPHITLPMVTVTMAFAMVTVPIAMVMMAASTVRCIPSSDWLLFSLRLYLYHPVALCWDLCVLYVREEDGCWMVCHRTNSHIQTHTYRVCVCV